MATFKKKELNELIGGDMNAGASDKAFTNDNEIETGPIEKPYGTDSEYEKGQSVTTDRVFGRYRQNIPWFAVYSYGGHRTGGGINTFESQIVKKKSVEEKIEDLVKKSKSNDVTDKNYSPKVCKMIDTIKDIELTDKQLEDLEKAINDKKNQKSTPKNI